TAEDAPYEIRACRMVRRADSDDRAVVAFEALLASIVRIVPGHLAVVTAIGFEHQRRPHVEQVGDAKEVLVQVEDGYVDQPVIDSGVKDCDQPGTSLERAGTSGGRV